MTPLVLKYTHPRLGCICLLAECFLFLALWTGTRVASGEAVCYHAILCYLAIDRVGAWHIFLNSSTEVWLQDMARRIVQPNLCPGPDLRHPY